MKQLHDATSTDQKLQIIQVLDHQDLSGEFPCSTLPLFQEQ